MLCPFSFTPHMASVIVDVIILLFINVVGPQIYEHHMQMCNEKLGSLFFSVADLIMITIHSSIWLASVNVLHSSSPFPGWHLHVEVSLSLTVFGTLVLSLYSVLWTSAGLRWEWLVWTSLWVGDLCSTVVRIPRVLLMFATADGSCCNSCFVLLVIFWWFGALLQLSLALWNPLKSVNPWPCIQPPDFCVGGASFFR